MNYCQFHPIEAATWRCPHCLYDLCDTCVDEGNNNKTHVCMSCGTSVESLGSVHSAIPFWRRLEESFRYPMNSIAIAVIVGVALLESAAEYLPMGFLFQLLLTGVIFSYSFECMKQTANGSMVAPALSSTYQEGVTIMVRLYAIIVVMGIAVSFGYHFFGSGMASLFSCLLTLALPAVFILYGLSESVMEAINPRSIINLVTAIGMPYGLIIAFIMIMVSSVGVIQEVMGNIPFLSSILQSIVSNFYLIVMFHIMGYMIFQYQGELGFTARENHGDTKNTRTELSRMKSRIQIYLKEGRYEDMIALYEQAFKSNPDDKALVEDCFKFLVSTQNTKDLVEFASFYLEFLIKNKREDQLATVYKQLVLLIPDFLPDTAKLRHALAINFFERGDFKVAIKMLNGLHTTFPAYSELKMGYELMAKCLDALPNMQAQAEKYRQFAMKLEKKVNTVS